MCLLVVTVVFFHCLNVCSFSSPLEVISTASSPSGTPATTSQKATQFASSAELLGAVINLKAPKVGDNPAEEERKRKGADYERVTHSHEASDTVDFAETLPGRGLNDRPSSGDRGNSVEVPVIAAPSKSVVYSRDSAGSRHLSHPSSYAAVASSAADAAGDETDLRSSRAPHTTDQHTLQQEHSSPVKERPTSDSKKEGSRSRVDNRPKW